MRGSTIKVYSIMTLVSILVLGSVSDQVQGQGRDLDLDLHFGRPELPGAHHPIQAWAIGVPPFPPRQRHRAVYVPA